MSALNRVINTEISKSSQLRNDVLAEHEIATELLLVGLNGIRSELQISRIELVIMEHEIDQKIRNGVLGEYIRYEDSKVLQKAMEAICRHLPNCEPNDSFRRYVIRAAGDFREESQKESILD